MREVLVLLQIVIAVGVVAATLVMGSQMRYIANRPLGFDKDNWVLVTIRGFHNFVRLPALAEELKRDPRVLAVTQAGVTPGRDAGNGLLGVENEKGEMQPTRVNVIEIDPSFVKAMKLQLIAGDDLPADARNRNRQHILVNETLVRDMGWSDPIGKRVFRGRVVGVVRDFNFQSLRETIGPLVMASVSDDEKEEPEARRPLVQRLLLIQLSSAQFTQALAYVEETIRRFDPGLPFEYKLLDESLQEVYSTERRMLALIAIFATLCIFISCLGLYGLTAFVTERRSREIAIRKVLGASAWQVVLLLARRTLILTALGGLIAAAIAWIVMDEWLSGFAYRVTLNPLLLVVSILLAAGVALGTVALQSHRIARADPSETLRDE